MGIDTEWQRVNEQLLSLRHFSRLQPTIDAMLRLAAEIRKDPRLRSIIPSVSLASLRLKRPDFKRYVLVAWNERETKKFEVSYVDPPLEVSDTTTVCEGNVVAIIVGYLERLSSNEMIS